MMYEIDHWQKGYQTGSNLRAQFSGEPQKIHDLLVHNQLIVRTVTKTPTLFTAPPAYYEGLVAGLRGDSDDHTQ